VTQKWAESYEPAVEAHAKAAEHYEWRQLCAEIGIVVASVALLLANRKMWFASVLLGVGGAVTLAWTFTTTHGHLKHAKEEIERAKAEVEHVRKSHGKAKDDDAELMAVIERKIASLPAPPGAAAAAPQQGHAGGEAPDHEGAAHQGPNPSEARH
jgi:hypothetical protein